LYKSTKHVCILGRGNITAPVFLIGEAPGQAEEKYGKPFCGRAGKLLDSLIVRVGLAGLVYISNVCHCRPPSNRKPTEEEAGICWPYTLGEISIVQSQVIVLLGRTAMDAVGVDKSLRGDHFYDSRLKAHVIATWHPAYVLRKGKKEKEELLQALELARGLCEQGH
jgi:DNA polymerase